MSDAIVGARAVASFPNLGGARALSAAPQEGGSFRDTLAHALGQVQGLRDQAGGTVEAFLRGEPVDVHEVMAAVEEAGIALEMLIEVRNRLTEAYRTVINMQS